MDTVKNVLGKMGKRLGEAARKTETLNARDYPRRFPLLLEPLRRSTRDAGLAPTGHCSAEPPPRSHVLPIRARHAGPSLSPPAPSLSNVPPNILRDAWELVIWGLLQGGGISLSLSSELPVRIVVVLKRLDHYFFPILVTSNRHKALRKDMAICASSVDIIKDMMLD
uniref:Uncharacterized protein n=1 Tax=Oryza meridionalis TaxID=40149 RepID=A0A0E0DNH7_9ORYZ